MVDLDGDLVIMIIMVIMVIVVIMIIMVIMVIMIVTMRINVNCTWRENTLQ